MFPAEQPMYFSWPYPSNQPQYPTNQPQYPTDQPEYPTNQPQYPTAQDLLYSASMDQQDRGIGQTSQYSPPHQQQYYTATPYESSDLQQQGYASGMDASVYGQNYTDDQGYTIQEDPYMGQQQFNQAQTQAAAYDVNGQVYDYSNTYSAATAQYDTSASNYDLQNNSSYMDSTSASSMQDLQYSTRGTYDQADTSSLYTQQRLYVPSTAGPTGTSQASYSGPSRQQASTQYLQQPIASQQQRLVAFESPASRSGRLKISEPLQAPGNGTGSAGVLQQSGGHINSHLNRTHEKLKEAQVMKQSLVEQLARTAPLW